MSFSIVQVITLRLTFNTISVADAGQYWCNGYSDTANINVTTNPTAISVTRESLPVTKVEILCDQLVVLLWLLVVLVNNSV